MNKIPLKVHTLIHTAAHWSFATDKPFCQQPIQNSVRTKTNIQFHEGFACATSFQFTFFVSVSVPTERETDRDKNTYDEIETSSPLNELYYCGHLFFSFVFLLWTLVLFLILSIKLNLRLWLCAMCMRFAYWSHST